MVAASYYTPVERVDTTVTRLLFQVRATLRERERVCVCVCVCECVHSIVITIMGVQGCVIMIECVWMMSKWWMFDTVYSLAPIIAYNGLLKVILSELCYSDHNTIKVCQ